jgi:copper resistance protein C
MKVFAKIGTMIAISLLTFDPTVARASLEPTIGTAEDEPQTDSANLVLMFPESVDLGSSTIEVMDSRRRRIPIDLPELDKNGKDVVIQLRGPLEPGVYTIKWRALSIYGHTIQGVYNFNVDP